MIKLDLFIKESLCNIVNGIKDAQGELKDAGCVINPKNITYSDLKNAHIDVTPGRPDHIKLQSGGSHPKPVHQQVHNIEFDVSVVVQKESNSGAKGKGKLGIGVASVELGGGGNQSSSNSSISKIKFSIPVVFPGP